MSRKPGKDDLDLWRRVAQTATRMERPKFPVEDMPPKVRKTDKPKRQPLPSFEIGSRSGPRPQTAAIPGDVGSRLAALPVQMDRKAYTRMKRGKLVPDAKIDLHGMTLDQAHGMLTRFVLNQSGRGARLLLVITGKGDRDDPHDPLPMRRGVLKRQVPDWLRQPPLGPLVLQVTEAHRSHGGSGAYYVYLRRSR